MAKSPVKSVRFQKAKPPKQAKKNKTKAFRKSSAGSSKTKVKTDAKTKKGGAKKTKKTKVVKASYKVRTGFHFHCTHAPGTGYGCDHGQAQQQNF